MLSQDAAIAANRFGLGARPTDARSIGGDPAGWLGAQLEQAASSRYAPKQPPESALTLSRVGELRFDRQRARRAEQNRDQPSAAQLETIREFGRFIRGEYTTTVAQRYRRAIETDSPFVERLVHFWGNHFAVSADKQPIAALAVAFEDEAIRPHLTGNFVELLTAVEQHPAMLLYLDNQQSIGPNSRVARAARRIRQRDVGLNENLAREILELHTLGVDGGYDQHDVTEFAKVLTGWSIGRAEGPAAGGRPGEFSFRANMHEPGTKQVLGRSYRDDGIEEGRGVLEALALHRSTARHLAGKLARHFVADDPPAGLVERLAEIYLRHGGELMPVYRALIEAPESWQRPLAKYKTPEEFVISTFRALDRAPDDMQQVFAFMNVLGQQPLTPGAPAGWPDTAEHWNGGDALLKRVEWAAAVGRRIGDRIDPVALAGAVMGPVASEQTLAAVARAESAGQGLGLLFASPEFQRR